MNDFTFQDAITKIEELEPRGWRLGLDRMAAFCRHANLEEYLGTGTPRYIHVAGTNGKGSTTAFVEALLRSAGLKTGAFFSPYVRDYRERIQAEGRLISKANLARLTRRLLNDTETFSESEYGGITKFEFECALGFLFWGEAQLDWVALEVGLGGRLDATNVVQPACSVIVSIGLDHVALLGDTLPQIAGEKAGIIKPGAPLVIGVMAEEAAQVIEKKAADLGVQVWRAEREIVWSRQGGSLTVRTPAAVFPDLFPTLVGDVQDHNLALALGAVTLAGIPLSPEQVSHAASTAHAPGRFETHSFEGVAIVVDGAHNADAARSLVRSLDTHYRHSSPRILIANTLTGHESDAFFQQLKSSFTDVLVPPIDSPRAVPPAEAARNLSRWFSNVSIFDSSEAAFLSAVHRAGPNGLVVVTGSNYLAGEILNRFFPDPIEW